MKNNRALFTISALVGVITLLQTGCMDAGDPGSGIDPKNEFRNIKAGLRRSKKVSSLETRIQLLRKTYDAAGNLKTRWPDAPKIDSFLLKNKSSLEQIPHDIYTLSLEARDLESFRWALRHSPNLDPQPSIFERIWYMGEEWRAMALINFQEKALPVFIKKTIASHDVLFFNAHASAFLDYGASLETPLDTSEFNCDYTRFLAKEFDAAVKMNIGPRIDFLLEHTPSQDKTTVLDSRVGAIFRALGDYLFYDLKDEALAGKLLGLRYPLNKIELDKTGFGDGFMKRLKADAEYAVQVLGLDQWTGPLNKETVTFLVSLSTDELKVVDKNYVEEIIELCLRKSKTEMALRYIQFLEDSDSISPDRYKMLLDWSIKYGNTELFENIVEAYEETSLYEVELVQLATNYKMFVKYAPRILAYLSKYEITTEAGEKVTSKSAMDKVLASTNHAASVYLIKKYKLDRESQPDKNDGRTLLMNMCLAGNLPAVKHLVEVRKEDIHDRTPYSEMSQSLFGRSKPAEGNLSPIHFAAQSGNSELIKYLALKRVNVNSKTHYGVTPLMFAVSNGRLEATKMLISLRANVNATMDARFASLPMPESGTFEELSNAFRRANKYGHNEILTVLKEAGAKP